MTYAVIQVPKIYLQVVMSYFFLIIAYIKNNT